MIDVAEKECEKMSQNSEMSENISEQQDIAMVHSLNCLQTYPNVMLVSDSAALLCYLTIPRVGLGDIYQYNVIWN